MKQPFQDWRLLVILAVPLVLWQEWAGSFDVQAATPIDFGAVLKLKEAISPVLNQARELPNAQPLINPFGLAQGQVELPDPSTYMTRLDLPRFDPSQFDPNFHLYTPSAIRAMNANQTQSYEYVADSSVIKRSAVWSDPFQFSRTYAEWQKPFAPSAELTVQPDPAPVTANAMEIASGARSSTSL